MFLMLNNNKYSVSDLEFYVKFSMHTGRALWQSNISFLTDCFGWKEMKTRLWFKKKSTECVCQQVNLST